MLLAPILQTVLDPKVLRHVRAAEFHGRIAAPPDGRHRGFAALLLFGIES